MDWIMKTFHSLQSEIEAPEETSSSGVNSTLQIPGQILNDSVYQVCNLLGRPSVDIVFFHGLNLDGAKDAHLRTWLSAGGSKLWLEWILEEIPDARILLISYDAFARRTSQHGLMDMYLTCENLVQDLIAAQVGQRDCPVVLVGHSIGCLVMKALCTRLDSIPNPNEREQNLLLNVKALFYYSCPHHGSELADKSTGFSKGALFEELTTLNKAAQRRNETFREVRGKHGWSTYGIHEGLPTTLKGFKGYIVQEASARHDVDGFYTDPAADHFSVCRPESRTTSSFRQFLEFILGVLKKDKEEESPRFDIPNGIGLEGRVKSLMEKLQGAQRVGIVGMAGIGKTILAKALYNAISRKFEYSCFLTDVKGFMTKKDNQPLLRGKITEGLSRKGHQKDRSFSWGKLEGKKVLIVLDDVEFRSQVQVMIKSDGFSGESRVIATSRDSRFLTAEGFYCYSVEPLEPEDSKKLFCLDAFNTEIIPNDRKEKVESFVQKCGGLPLALTVVGKYLCAINDKEVWDDAFKSLSLALAANGSQQDELWSVLRVSYESLGTQEKQMFLDVANCFHGERLDLLKQAWRVCGWASLPDSGWRNLLDKGLVTTEKQRFWSWGTTYVEVIRMHEVLRDLGRSVACREPENVASHSRVRYDLSTTWPFDEGAEVKVLKIGSSDVDFFYPREFNISLHESAVITTKSLHGLKELRILWVDDDISLCGPCNWLPPKLAYMRCGRWLCHPEPVAESGGQHPAFRCLEIRQYASERVPNTLDDLQNLVHLVLSSRCLTAIPKTVGELRALRHLELTGCHDWEGLLDIVGQLKALQKLLIHKSTYCSCDTIGQLEFLESLQMRGLLQGAGQVDLPVFHERSIRISNYNSKLLPSSFSLFPGEAIKITIEDCRSLKALPGLGRCQASVTTLEILNCDNLEALSDTIWELQALRCLRIQSCCNLKYLPDSLGKLPRLQRLEISDCHGLTALPGSLGNVQGLEELSIWRCQNLEALPDSLGELRCLQRLEIWDCQGLRALPGSLGNVQGLEELSIWRCQNLEALPDSLGELRRLQHLHIWDCDGLRALPGSLGNVEGLEELRILEEVRMWS